MPELKLTSKQADLIAEQLTTKIEGAMEEADQFGGEPEALLAEWDNLTPMVEALRELSSSGGTENLSLLSEVAAEVLSNSRDSVGYEMTVIRRIEAGEVVQWLAADDKSAEDAIERAKKATERYTEQAHLAWLVIEAVRLAEAEAAAEAGDARAKESISVHRRWEEENRKLREGAVA
jgi:hypothetical protein